MTNGGSRRKYSKGQWEVERERCQIEDPFPSRGVEEASVISDIVPGILKRLGLADQHWLGVLESEWNKLVGDAVAKHTRPGRIENKKLTVFVESPVWLNELMRYGRAQMLANLQKRFGSHLIVSIQLVPDPDGGRSR